jgi:hypothetical protein
MRAVRRYKSQQDVLGISFREKWAYLFLGFLGSKNRE